MSSSTRQWLKGGILLLAIVTIAMTGCRLNKKNRDNHPFVTLVWNQDSDTIAAAAQTLEILSDRNLAFFEQEGDFNYVGGAIVFGFVEDQATPGTALAGVTVALVDDNGNPVGTVVYRDAAGVFDSTLTTTSTNGGFIIVHLYDDGNYLLTTTAGGEGGSWINVADEQVTMIDLVVDGAAVDVNVSGVVTLLDGATNAPDSTVVEFLATTVSGNVAGGAGAYGPIAVDGETAHLVRVLQAGHVDTIQWLAVGDAAINSPDGDLTIVSVAERDDTNFMPNEVTQGAGEGIIVGFVEDLASNPVAGVTVEAVDMNGNVVGDVVYTDAGGASDVGLTQTSTDGGFRIFAVTPGWIQVRIASSGSGNGYILVEAGDISLVGTLSAAAQGSVTVDGTIQTLANPPKTLKGASVTSVGGDSVVGTAGSAGVFSDLELETNSAVHLVVEKGTARD